MRKLLCKLGWHRGIWMNTSTMLFDRPYEYSDREPEKARGIGLPNSTIPSATRRCEICGKVERVEKMSYRNLRALNQQAVGWNNFSLKGLYVFNFNDYIDINKDNVWMWINQGIGHFKEWYQPVYFPTGQIAHVTVPPHWIPKPEYNKDRGTNKWNFIVKKHMPDLKGKRVLDLGCSTGVFSIEMARLGAKVIGIDRKKDIKQKSTDFGANQDVIRQAQFVKKAFEIFEGKKYDIEYQAEDIDSFDLKTLGKFDMILALNVVYHEMENMQRVVNDLASMTDHLVLQTALAHSGELAEYASVKNHMDVLIKAGFTLIHVDNPKDYKCPMIIAKK